MRSIKLRIINETHNDWDIPFPMSKPKSSVVFDKVSTRNISYLGYKYHRKKI